ncbi:MAG: hypothetical protein QUV35_12180, partial [Hydrogenophaga sp.]|uniref:hypothetical protein n=1 Tax=Hydrogenophaga sp. TaxID=1904254 RepID=UPI00262F9EE8
YSLIYQGEVTQVILARGGSEIDRVVGNSEMKESLAIAGFETLTLSPEDSARSLKLETEKWARIIRENNIRGS